MTNGIFSNPSGVSNRYDRRLGTKKPRKGVPGSNSKLSKSESEDASASVHNRGRKGQKREMKMDNGNENETAIRTSTTTTTTNSQSNTVDSNMRQGKGKSPVRMAVAVTVAAVGPDGFPGAVCPQCDGGHFFRRQQPGARWYCTGCALDCGPDDPLPGGVETMTLTGSGAQSVTRPGAEFRKKPWKTDGKPAPWPPPYPGQENAVDPPFLDEKRHARERRLTPPFVDTQELT